MNVDFATNQIDVISVIVFVVSGVVFIMWKYARKK